MTVVVLLSGGIDSSACLAFFCRRHESVAPLFADYGQLAAERERRAARAVSAYYNVPLTEARLIGRDKPSGLIQSRNAFLILLALLETQLQTGIISVGVHAGTAYWDCGAQFVDAVQNLLDGYTSGRVKLSCPFLTWTKAEIWDFCVTEGVPIKLTYSCELGLDEPCGKCVSCDDRQRLFAR